MAVLVWVTTAVDGSFAARRTAALPVQGGGDAVAELALAVGERVQDVALREDARAHRVGIQDDPGVSRQARVDRQQACIQCLLVACQRFQFLERVHARPGEGIVKGVGSLVHPREPAAVSAESPDEDVEPATVAEYMGAEVDSIDAELGATVGGQISLISPQGRTTPFGTVPRIVSYNVAATFEVGVYDYDKAFVIMPIEDAQTLLMLDDSVSMIEVETVDPDNVEAILAPLAAQVTGRAVVTDWRSMNSALFEALSVERVAMFVILSLIILVAVFNILSSLIMLVRAKTRDIAILRTMGASRASLIKIFVTVGVTIGTLGTVAGLALGAVALFFRQPVINFVQIVTGQDLWDPSIRFLTELDAWAAGHQAAGRPLLFCGDLNVARTDMDVHAKEKRLNGIGQRPDERALIERILSRGLVDVHRMFEPDNPDLFTWWAPWRNMRQRNIGWRIDYILASQGLAAMLAPAADRRGRGDFAHPVVRGRRGLFGTRRRPRRHADFTRGGSGLRCARAGGADRDGAPRRAPAVGGADGGPRRAPHPRSPALRES